MAAQQKKEVRVGITARIIWLTALFTAAITLVMLLQSVRILSRQINQNNLQSTEYRLKTASITIGQRIREVDNLLDWSVSNASTRTFLFSGIRNNTLTNQVYSNVSAQCNDISSSPYIQRFLLAGSSGRTMMLGSVLGKSAPVNQQNIRLLPGAAEGEEMKWDRIVEDPLMQLSCYSEGIPISRIVSNGQSEALVYISVSPNLILDVLRDYTLEENACLYWEMGGAHYRVMGNQMVNTAIGTELIPDDSGNSTLGEDTLLFRGHTEAGDCFVVVCPLGMHDLSLAAVIPAETLMDQLPQMLPSFGFMLLLVIFLGCLLAATLQNVVRRPVAALRHKIDGISRGDFSQEPAIEWNHELGDIGKGINQMSRNITTLMERRVEDEKQKQELEFRMLQGQISPHFLYNALNSIQWMATIQQATGIAEMTTALSRLLKSVSKSTQRKIRLEEELALLNDYFTIQRYRYGGTITLEICWEAEEETAKSVLIPRFTLQPLAENAIFHGIEPKGCAGSLKLTIAMDSRKQDLLLYLADDGIGMTQERIRQVLESPEGKEPESKFRHVGVQNVNRRMIYSYGPEYALKIDSTPGEGTTITIRVPIRTEGEDS